MWEPEALGHPSSRLYIFSKVLYVLVANAHYKIYDYDNNSISSDDDDDDGISSIVDNKHVCSQPRWLIWMRRLTGDREVAGSTPAEVGNILLWRLIMKYFLRSFFHFR